MELLTTLLIVLTGLLLFSTTVCGLWMKFTNEVVEPSSKNFHVVIALLTVLSTVLTIGFLVK
jgi:hypothetical protein